MASNTNKDYTQMHIKASDHPKAYAPHILILNIVMSILGAIHGLDMSYVPCQHQQLYRRSVICNRYFTFTCLHF